MRKHLVVISLRIFAYPIMLLGVFTAVAVVGIPILLGGQAMLDAAQKIESGG